MNLTDLNYVAALVAAGRELNSWTTRTTTSVASVPVLFLLTIAGLRQPGDSIYYPALRA